MATQKRTKSMTLAEIASYSGHIAKAEFEITGAGVLLPHRMSSKAKKMMLGKQKGEARAKERKPKVPVVDAVDALYIIGKRPEIPEEYTSLLTEREIEGCELPFLPEQGIRYGIPAVAFKNAATRAAKGLGHAMTDVRSALFVNPDVKTSDNDVVEVFVEGMPAMQCDFCRVDNGKTADLRFRVGLPKWRTVLRVQHSLNFLTIEQLVAIFQDAGRFIGVGDWRPEKDGTYGLFEVTGVNFEDRTVSKPAAKSKQKVA